MIWILVEEIFVFRLLDIGLAAFGRRSLFRRWILCLPYVSGDRGVSFVLADVL